MKAAKEIQNNFLSMISHELRTPLNGILGMSELLKISGVENQNVHLLDNLNISASRLHLLLSDILHYVSLESEITESQSTTFTNETFKTNLEQLIYNYNGTSIPVELLYTENLPHNFTFNKDSVLKIIDCLLKNALKFSNRGTVQLIVSNQPNTSDKQKLNISVKDEGIGISPEHQKLIFNKFYQVDSGINRNYEGSGIGLTLAKRLADSIEASIQIQLAPEKGSQFTLTFPIKTPQSSRPLSSIPLSTAKILIVDDTRTNYTYLQRILKLKKCSTFIAENSEECFDILQREKIHLIFMDLMLPDKTGDEITIEIRELERFKTIPIIGVTARVDSASRNKCLNAGMDEFIPKPFTKSDIFNCLKHYFAHA